MSDHDLLVIGAGDLGTRIALRWRENHPQARVLVETISPSRHPDLAAAGLTPRRRRDPDPSPHPFVVFTVPPGDDYAGEAARATRLGRVRVVMSSSTGVYSEDRGDWCREDSALSDTARARRILSAERAVTAAHGIVVRLAGLYDRDRGPHRHWLTAGSSPRRPDGWVNLIHRDDAADLCCRALASDLEGPVLGADGEPMRRTELIEVAARLLGGGCEFTGTEGGLGRRLDPGRTWDALNWRPRFPSFEAGLRGAEAGSTDRRS